MLKKTDFRIWLQKIWAEHQQEVESWTGKPVEYPMEEYLLKYKWWLKTIYSKEKFHVRNIDISN